MSNQSVKQQIVEKIKDVDTVLIAVNSNPSVDELSAALGFTMLLNKMNKHATSVFSGKIPPAISFLDPEKTFENSVDSLRDFIIALDKEKADHLRYKVEGEMVKIFITPYRTTVDETDLEYSQGDYNVEMVVAVGVKDSSDLDRALADHGRIMHDATVASLSIGGESSELGSLNLHDDKANSYSEVVAGLSEALRDDKSLIDDQIATAYLTGIVAATERFSNNKTSTNIMTVAAQMMAAGANQQLIASKLEQVEAEKDNDDLSDQDSNQDGSSDQSTSRSDGTTRLDVGVSSKVNRQGGKKSRRRDKASGKNDQADNNQPDSKPDEPVDSAAKSNGGLIAIDHEASAKTETDNETNSIASTDAEKALADSLAATTDHISNNVPSLEDIQQDLRKAANHIDGATDLNQPPAETELVNPPATVEQQPVADNSVDESADTAPANELPAPAVDQSPTAKPDSGDPVADALQFEPTFGGTLNATSEQAAADKRREEALSRNRTILSHDSEPAAYLDGQPAGYPAVNSYGQNDETAEESPASSTLPPPTVSSRGKDIQPLAQTSSPAATPADTLLPTAAGVGSEDQAAQPQVDEAQAAIAAALEGASPQPGVPPLPSSDDAAAGSLPVAPLPPMPPDFSTLPPLPPAPGASFDASPQATEPASNGLPTVSPVNFAPASAAPSEPADPGQFQIPGQ